MSTSTLAMIGVAVLTLTACDLSQKKPETIKAAAPHNAALKAAPGAIGSSSLQPEASNVHTPEVRGRSGTGVESAAGGQSTRLYGPGVSRKRQIRV